MSSRNISIALLIFNSLAWSTLGIYIRILGQYFDIMQQVYLRVFVAAVLVGLFGFRQIGWSTLLRRLTVHDWLLITMRTSAMYLLGVALVSIAFIDGEYSTISLIKALPLTAILGFLVFQEPITRAKVLFVMLAFAGASLLIISDLQNSLAAGAVTFGRNELIALVSAGFLAFSHAARKWQRATVNNWESSFLMFVIGVPILVVASWLLGEGMLSIENVLAPEALFAMGMSGLLNAVGLVVINYALGHIDIVLTNNIFALQPVFGVVVGVLYYQDVTTLWELVGGIIIVGSLIGMNQASRGSR